MDDLASGAYQYLTSFGDVLARVGGFPADDPLNPGIPWVFQRNIYARMETASIVKGSQAVALVCIYAGQFQAPLDANTVRLQRLELDIWVDPLRDPLGQITDPTETEHRGDSIWSLCDSHLHRTGTDQNTILWGDLVTTACIRMSEPVWAPVPEGDGLIRGAGYYAVATYGNNIVSVGSGDVGGGTGG